MSGTPRKAHRQPSSPRTVGYGVIRAARMIHPSQKPAVLRPTVVFDNPPDEGRIVKEPGPDRRQAFQRRQIAGTVPA